MPETRCRTSGSGCTWSEVPTLDNGTLDKPADVFDRDAEWADLTDFALSRLPRLRIAVVYGKRRQGKSYLLRRLTGAVGGLYHLATEQAEPVSLRRFGDSLATWAGLWPAGSCTRDPLIRDTAAYSSVLAAVAAGESSPTKIGGLLGRPATSLAHQLTTLASARFIDRRHDLLLDRRPVVTIARTDGRALGGGERLGQFLGEPLVVRLQPAGFGEGGLPVGFQRPGDQTVFRFGQLALAAGPVGGVAARSSRWRHSLSSMARSASAWAAAARETSTEAGATASSTCLVTRRPGQARRCAGSSDEPGRPRPRLRLVTMATTPPGPHPMALLPHPAQSRPRHLTIARRKGPSYNKQTGPVVPAGRELAGPASYPAPRDWVTRLASTGSPSPDRSARAAGRPATAMRIPSAGPVNIRAVLRWCLSRADTARGIDLAVSLGWYWVTRATTEGMRWLDEFLASAGGDSFTRTRAYFIRGFLGVLKGDPAAARPALREAVAAARQAGLRDLLSEALSLASIAETMACDHASAKRLLDEAHLTTTGLDYPSGRLAVLQAQALNGLFEADLDAVRGRCLRRSAPRQGSR